MYFIREFKEEDLYEVLNIANESLTESYAPELFLDIHRLWPRGFLVAVARDIIGFIAGSKQNREARILLLAVKGIYRGKGIGSALMRRFMSLSKSEGILSVRLEVRTTNFKAIEFYKKFGFNIISYVPNYYTNGDAAYIMWREI
ncbi:ribosomal protein S18-alanine N-acetyltransferase [Candidatus Aciduliprofundum boonei]|uniref:Ribosomal-protein-alanine acetyltransferase n=1 Tax=Aciduliprofundum boonei (strain DSM 19572 / T469) TaxID=439481 RepID=B5IAW6_ACIB4|nr:ribosomal protein S18-alanine N-acetyltransferase [Candidatus Aciduliprofundum boonei]ADD09100.1 ribosomal-protein-alanine acetyltransferase [Aciduliprofundum boonei T469]EDY36047.1 ribosomal-protein-alanine acetyltransferase [Aciduliprofundum boonei T469]EDY36383.1 ribosomal-protein-alanine acetyltransferase [Aciduliprofundum boonei T469]HII55352.1 ribosomal protein S18-alanine N-acetyltransferase [Candidatus Aciduliprofundum boonei]